MAEAIYPLDIVIKKRDGEELSRDEIETFVRAVVHSGDAKGSDASLPVAECVSDAQIASFLMAVFQQGLSGRELADLTQAMRFSGETLNLGDLDTFTIDKHSTGGVGDKTSLLIAPIIAAAGIESTPSISVPMISGRSLGHTGGTLDKLETIPGFDTQLSLHRMREVLRVCHAVMVGQTPRLVPADRILYALRDHTGTVESPYLITASIMSKKLAEDLRGLVLDVKVGSGAFMPTYGASKQLAELMVATGERAGTRTVALLTSMDQPLGRFAGNWVEVWECIDILKGVPHPMSADLIELSCVLAGCMLCLAGKSPTLEAGAAAAGQLLRNGKALASWLQIVRAQGGDLSVFDDPASVHQPLATRVLHAPHDGFLGGMNCKQVGWAVQRLGAGRARPGDPVNAHAGIEVHAKIGDAVKEGQPIFTLFSENEDLIEAPLRMMSEALVFSTMRPAPCAPLVHEIVRG
ncbi:MAG: thymidine phosphorylase [Janthinobacterium lividum]